MRTYKIRGSHKTAAPILIVSQSPKGHPLYETINYHLISRIQEPAWDEMLKKYRAAQK